MPRLFKYDEIMNIHGQRIYYFSSQPGKTELEKDINFLILSLIQYGIYRTTTTDNINLICLLTSSGMEVFNDKEEKIGESEVDIENVSNPTQQDIYEINYYLEDLGFNI